MSEEKKNEILQEKLDTEELEAVSGGKKMESGSNNGPKIDKHGGCSSNYWKEKCSATVENGSCCWKDDHCSVFSEKYTFAPIRQ